MGKAQREKGKRGERATVNEVKDAFPWLGEAIKRGWQARAGDDAPDVDGVPGIWIECKAGAKPNPRAALQQAIAACKTRVPVVVIRDDRKEPFAVMRWPDLLRLLASVSETWMVQGGS